MTQHQEIKLSEAAQPVRRMLDSLLVSLVEGAETKGFSLGISVWIGGSLVSGQLISSRDWMLEVAAEFDESEAGSIADAFRGGASSVDPEPEEQSLPNFIHLKNARMMTGAGLVPMNRGVAWRGLLEAVDAWAFGELSASA